MLLLIFMHGFFVAGEFGVVAVDRSRIEQLADEGDQRAQAVLKALRTLSFQLSGAQLGITITSLLVGFLIEPVIAPLLEPLLEALPFIPSSSVFGVSVAVGLTLATTFEMVVAELIPKNLAIAKPQPVAFALATPLRLVNQLLKPLIVFLNASANWTVRLFGIEPRDELTSVHSLEELQILIRSSREGGAIEEEDFSLLSRSITFGDKLAADALTPRTAIKSLTETDSIQDLIRLAMDTGRSRFPVTREGIDDIAGVAHVKDAFTIPAGERAGTQVGRIMREPLVVPESRDLASLLLEMRRDGQQLAVVIDEFGGTSGLVTLEDLLEEIVGEIEDEYDPRERAIQLTEPPSGIHIVPGLMHPHEVEEATGFEMPDGDYDTLAGFLLTLFDRIPAQGDQTAHEGWEFKVVEMDRNRIARVLIVNPPRDPEERA